MVANLLIHLKNIQLQITATFNVISMKHDQQVSVQATHNTELLPCAGGV